MSKEVDEIVDPVPRFPICHRLCNAALGFPKVVPRETGRPHYGPAYLLRLYLYGYLHRVRSSRQLKRECGRNLEVLWLLRKLAPDKKTIADFRKDYLAALRGVWRKFTLFCQNLELFGGELFSRRFKLSGHVQIVSYLQSQYIG